MHANEFKTYHPIVNLTYFIFVIGFSMFFMHPVCLAISFSCGLTYSIILEGKKAVKTNVFLIIPIIFVMGIINPIFNHNGETIITYFPNGNPLTLESVIYGFAAAVMIGSVICHFSCYTIVVTEDKVIYLFGRIMSSFSLILSMTMRFVPRLVQQLTEVKNAQKCIGNDIAHGGIIKRTKAAITILSITVSRSLENAISTADSMKARGYGLKGRTAFSVFRFKSKDLKALICIFILGIYVIAGAITKSVSFAYFPSINGAELSLHNLSVFAAYFMLCMIPIIIELWEEARWKCIISRI